MIEFKKVVKSYDNQIKVVNGLDFKINDGELVVLIGESGCGKTTTMKMINRLIEPTGGEILINGKNIMSINPIELRRNIGYVIQKVGLLPHMTVGDNIELVPYLQKWDKKKRRARAEELLDLVNLEPSQYIDRYPNELSGGQQQRVGVARALAVNPDIILMDEPFSAVDPLTRDQLQEELLKLQDEVKKTIVFVTHDMDEALKLGDRIAVMRDGKIIQYDTPENILKNPVDDFVEYFVGKDRLWKSPEMLFAKDIMNKKPIMILQDRTPANAVEIMKEKNVEYLLVVNQVGDRPKKLLGIVTPRELSGKGISQYKMKDIMRTQFTTVTEKTSMVHVLQTMKDKKIKNLPVVGEEDGYLKGLITHTSILNILTEAISVYDDDREGY
ncbi:osmoprotectant transport system ATP-binding protein [Natronincola peptidivorans]|uniref:Quaternary amine transport ATP-binding protein n=1 Tax=Natronincola peptidivorans TaxID=426128 RepID=A0A1I0DBK3_9FIRM|nr:betaine/proline/choline family ABC transporter ATP-binding protein [Natronincola peptidivorans]SET29680.1 osmoprotectant transport system ATP-binding protein [Natronincola peptidivorans]